MISPNLMKNTFRFWQPLQLAFCSEPGFLVLLNLKAMIIMTTNREKKLLPASGPARWTRR